MPISRFWHESGTQFTPADLKKMVDQYGQNILVGGDPGWNEDFEEAMKAVDFHGAYKHVYLTGPGMMEWSPEEVKEIKAAAKSIGIDTSKPSWKDQWFKAGGWEKKVQAWFKEYDAKGFYSAEIDNLDAVMDQDPDKFIAFLDRLDTFLCKYNLTIKLMVKNLSEDQLTALIDYQPRPELLCEFGMFEAGSGCPSRQANLAAKIGIQAVTPRNGLRDTKNYGTDRKGIPYTIT